MVMFSSIYAPSFQTETKEATTHNVIAAEVSTPKNILGFFYI